MDIFKMNQNPRQDLSKEQRKLLKKGCPECKGKLKVYFDSMTNDVYLDCLDCDVRIDESGGYTK